VAQSPPYHFLWAKASRTEPDLFHPLVCHMLETAAVAERLWQVVVGEPLAGEVASDLRLEEEQAGRWIAFLSGAHDLGKATPAFQSRDASLFQRVQAAGFPACGANQTSAPSHHHGVLTASLLKAYLEGDGSSIACLVPRLALGLAVAVGGHHGVFPRPQAVNMAAASPAVVGGETWAQARKALLNDLAGFVGLDKASPTPQMPSSMRSYVLLAGIASVADWLASNEEFFPYAALPLEKGQLAEQAREKARKAIEAIGWQRVSNGRETFEELFGGKTPRPLQRAADLLSAAVAEPSLTIIEAPTGEGKTEAALLLARRWQRRLGHKGVYVALPTCATAEQMHRRLLAFLKAAYPQLRQRLPLVLLHGRTLLDRIVRQCAPAAIHPGDESYIPRVEWFSEGRKRGLLAPFGAGTVDQALLAALPTHHVFVRLFGLANKTVILDEVHAYDTYMTTLLERLLEWLAALRCSVVVLSATLPAQRARKLIEAFAAGTGHRQVASKPLAPYPRVTHLTGGAVESQHVETSTVASRSVSVQWIHPDQLIPTLKSALRNGGCAAVVCNTVNRAQNLFLEIKKAMAADWQGPSPRLDLLHGSFPLGERQKREERIIGLYGPPGFAPERPRCAILVATQVIEQSLDLDFDILFTDLAPADLILQRAGRLHRHSRLARPADLSRPRLVILRPVESPDQTVQFDPGSQAVYDPHLLLRTWLSLKDVATLRVPDQTEAIIEATYEDAEPPSRLPEPLRHQWQETRRRHHQAMLEEAEEAKTRWIKRPNSDVPIWDLIADALEEDSPQIHQKLQALTRLAPPSVHIVCLYRTDHGLALDPAGRHPVDTNAPPDQATLRQLLLRSLSTASRAVVNEILAMEPPKRWRRVPVLRYHRILELGPNGTAQVGNAEVRLDPELGLVISKSQH